MRLSTRLTIAMVALVLLTAVTVSAITYHNIATLALPRALDRIEMQARLLAAKLEGSVSSARSDVGTQGQALQALASTSIGDGAQPVDGTPRERLISRFIAELNAKPSYSQFRLIGIQDSGREIVRVDRSGANGAIRVVPDAELQRQGGQDYFKAAIALPRGQVHVSPVTLNREHNAIDPALTPTLRVASPIFTPEGRPFGILIVNIDLTSTFGSVRADTRPDEQVYVVNEHGDYLVHPDRRREFGFEFDRPSRIQDDFPEVAGLLKSGDVAPRLIKDPSGAEFGMGWETARLAGGTPIAIVRLVPYDKVFAGNRAIRNAMLLGGLAAAIFAIVLAVIFARSVTRQLVQVTRAVEGFGRDDQVDVPTNAPGEIGVLARALAQMRAQIQEKTAALQHEIEERKSIFDTSLDLILVTDSRGTFMRVSPSATMILGYHPDEMIGHTADDFIHPEDVEATRNEMRLARRGLNMRNFETRYVHKNGHTVLLAWSGVWSAPERRYFFIGRDMTEKMQAEEKFRLAVEASPSGIVMIDTKGSIVLVNAETERLFGYRRDELIGRSVDMLVPAAARSRHAGHRADYVARPATRRMGVGRELYGLRKDGSEFPVEIGLNPIRGRDGLLILSAIVDISRSKTAEQALRESEQMARGIVTNALDAFIQLTEHGIVLEWNPQAEVILGWSREEAVGQQLSNLYLPKGYRPRYIDIAAKLHEAGKDAPLPPGQRFEFEAVRKDGRSIKVEVSLTASRRGGIYVFNLFLRDFTAQLAREEQLRQAQKMEAVGQLTGGIAHDFNNMLTVITGTIDILADAVADKPQLAAIAKLISEAADRGAELTAHLLAFARKQPLQPRETDVNSLVVEAGRLLRSVLGEHVEIESRLLEAAWPALVDPTQLTTALVNLSVNARDAMPHGGKLTLESGNVTLDQAYASANAGVQPGDYVMVAVSDTGGGIPETIRDKVFEPFFTTKEVGKGTGLGLSMVYGFIKQSNGHIKVYSEEGHGTTFKLYLPRAGVRADVQAEELHAPAVEGGDEAILVVEDDSVVRAYVIAQLQGLGYKTFSAANSGEALAIVESGAHFDLLFTDVIMPGTMNGRQLADEITKRRADLKVLFTSGYTENAIMHHGRLDPGVLLLAKPYRRHDLARMIRLALTVPYKIAQAPPIQSAKTG